MRFWIHHQPLLCPDALILRYEETVTDFLAQVERIADYLGIEDRTPLADVLRSMPRARATSARRAIPRSSSRSTPGPWRDGSPIALYFEPVFPILQPIADHWDYRLED